MLQKIRKNFALKKIFKKMPGSLVGRYGVSEEYTQGQVARTMEVESLNSDYIDYAYATFLSFDDAVACVGNEEMVLNIQSEVIQQYLGGEKNLKAIFEKARKVGNASSDYGSYGSGDNS